jgi:hypothetical protein
MKHRFAATGKLSREGREAGEGKSDSAILFAAKNVHGEIR